MNGRYSGIFGVRIQTQCQKVSVLVSDPRHLETIIMRGDNTSAGFTQWAKTLRFKTKVKLEYKNFSAFSSFQLFGLFLNLSINSVFAHCESVACKSKLHFLLTYCLIGKVFDTAC